MQSRARRSSFPIASVAWLVLAAALGAAGCSARVDVTSDYNPETNFSKLHTFAWLPVAHETGDPRADSPILAGRIRRAVVSDLEDKGFRQVRPDEKPDFYVTYQAAIAEKVSVRSSPAYAGGFGYAGYGYRGWAGRPWGGPVGYVGTETTVKQYDQGTLILDVVDRERDDLIWRGSAQAKLQKNDNRTSAERDEATKVVVRDILKDFPPKGA